MLRGQICIPSQGWIASVGEDVSRQGHSGVCHRLQLGLNSEQRVNKSHWKRLEVWLKKPLPSAVPEWASVSFGFAAGWMCWKVNACPQDTVELQPCPWAVWNGAPAWAGLTAAFMWLPHAFLASVFFYPALFTAKAVQIFTLINNQGATPNVNRYVWLTAAQLRPKGTAVC